MTKFHKYHGLGNDFILIDNRHQSEPIINQEQAIKMCDRHLGIGADGVIFVLPGQDGTDYTMRIFNSDGSEPQMCGNGIRCFAKFIALLAGTTTPTSYQIHTLAGVIKPEITANGEVTVDMGKPRLLAEEIPTTLVEEGERVVEHTLDVDGKTWFVTCVSMGNPHCITFVNHVNNIALEKIGPLFENDTAFPERTNIEFIEVVNRQYLKMRVWERGAGITMACGTGACASLVAGVLTNRCDRSATIELPGGCLQITWSEEDQHIYMTGPAEFVFTGEYQES